MQQEKIKKKQNESFSLNCQFTAKHYFNKAESLNYLIWILCILSSITIIFQNKSNLGLFIPFSINIIILILQHYLEYCVKMASKLRNYFDVVVLEINTRRYTEADLREIKGIIYKTITRYPKEHQIQITHTGKDSPPGVLNWYEFSRDFADNEAQYECQRQNCWWNEELSKKRVIYSLIMFGTICTLIIFIAFTNLSLTGEFIRIILGASGIFCKSLERLYQHYKYHAISLKIQGACSLLEFEKSKSNIENLQLKIEERRETPVLEVNNIHKRLAAKLSYQYEKITSLIRKI